jgi:hypothetical protein
VGTVAGRIKTLKRKMEGFLHVGSGVGGLFPMSLSRLKHFRFRRFKAGHQQRDAVCWQEICVHLKPKRFGAGEARK